ncbi:hypothetical protein [Actinoplanes philippinensis]|uniref:hypothetical protein n=1 Tax=Actinoplanes philippinensis TaxID=35752 RepID=UPI0033CDC064
MNLVVNRAVPNRMVQQTLRSRLRFHYPQVDDVVFRADHVELSLRSALPDGDAVARLLLTMADTYATLPDVPPRVIHDATGRPRQKTHAGTMWSPGQERSFRAALTALLADITEADQVATTLTGLPTRYPSGRGLNTYGSDEVALHRILDNLLRQVFVRCFGAAELRAPSMIATATLDRSGYLGTSYQHLNFVSPLDHRPESFDGFQPYWNGRDGAAETRVDGIRDFLAAPADVLNPALCLHCYPLLEGAAVAADAPSVLTLAGSCFRDESGNLNHGERLREFFMREAVFVGSRASLESLHGEILRLLTRLGAVCGLPFRLEHASDIFFSDGAPQRLFSQMLSDNKIEMVVPQEDGTGVAIASLNRHDNHFTSKFEITTPDGGAAASMCVGVGIDRLALSLGAYAAADGIPTLRFLHRAVTDYLVSEPRDEDIR